MAGLIPGHPRLPLLKAAKTGCPAQGRHDDLSTETDFIGCFLSQTLRMSQLDVLPAIDVDLGPFT